MPDRVPGSPDHALARRRHRRAMAPVRPRGSPRDRRHEHVVESPLYLQDDDVIGALNLYAQKPNAFDDTDRSTLAILSTHSGPPSPWPPIDKPRTTSPWL